MRESWTRQFESTIFFKKLSPVGITSLVFQVHICIGDITQQAVRENLINQTIQQFGQLDVLVSCLCFDFEDF